MPMSLNNEGLLLKKNKGESYLLVSFFCMIMLLCTSPELHKQLFMSASSSS